ncbi:MAG: helix-turn-helix transcriptional regulator, partial [Chloroflexi bacterium]|nr:helix-turn-helix transcriptional regulator [Chloroflexota bacterium]
MKPRARRPALALEAEAVNRQQLGRLGAEVRLSRKRRRLTQASLGRRAGVAQMTVSRLERGHGGGLSLDTWQRVALALGL